MPAFNSWLHHSFLGVLIMKHTDFMILGVNAVRLFFWSVLRGRVGSGGTRLWDTKRPSKISMTLLRYVKHLFKKIYAAFVWCKGCDCRHWLSHLAGSWWDSEGKLKRFLVVMQTQKNSCPATSRHIVSSLLQPIFEVGRKRLPTFVGGVERGAVLRVRWWWLSCMMCNRMKVWVWGLRLRFGLRGLMIEV